MAFSRETQELVSWHCRDCDQQFTLVNPDEEEIDYCPRCGGDRL